MKILIAPDKFKGSLTAFEVCEAITRGISAVDETIETVSFPMADGGDGFATVMQYYLQTASVSCHTVDPLGRPIDVSYQWNEKTKTAIIEMAVASGLVLLTTSELNPLRTSTYGTGLLIKDAIGRGAVTIILGLGGSATNDGGIGILEALGFQLRDGNNHLLAGTGGNLAAIRTIISPIVPDVKFEIACDVQNLLYGADGASAVYGPQKGADAAQVKFLDDGLKNLVEVLLQQTGKDVASIKGSGAAGGIAASLIGFFDVELKSGIQLVLDVSGFEAALETADLVITGEGKIDLQSMEGKVVGRIASFAGEKNKKVIAVCGRLELNDVDIKETGLTGAFAIGGLLPLEESMRQAANLLEQKMKELLNNIDPLRP